MNDITLVQRRQSIVQRFLAKIVITGQSLGRSARSRKGRAA